MKAKQFVAIGKQLAANLPPSVVRGPLLVLLPVGQVLSGLCFEGSGFDAASFYVNWFFMPLFVPADVVHFSHGNRIRQKSGSDDWSRNDPDYVVALNDAVQSDALPRLLRAETIPGAINILEEQLDRSGGKAGASREALAYCLAFAGEYRLAKEHLEKMAASLNRSIEWQKEKAERAELLIRKIAEGQEAVRAQLDEWRSQTLRNLKLEDLAYQTLPKQAADTRADRGNRPQ